MVNLNIFATFPLECLTGFFYNFDNFKIVHRYAFNNKNDFLIIEKRHSIFRFINDFKLYFSPKFRSICFQDCLETHSYIPMFLALKIYQTHLSIPNLSLEYFEKSISIYEFVNIVVKKNIMSQATINILIEKNWRYHQHGQI